MYELPIHAAVLTGVFFHCSANINNGLGQEWFMSKFRKHEHLSVIKFNYTSYDLTVVYCSCCLCPWDSVSCVCEQCCRHFESTCCLHLQGRNGKGDRVFVYIQISVQQTHGGSRVACAQSGHFSIDPDLELVPTLPPWVCWRNTYMYMISHSP
jgi:hypothetical protein